MKTVCSRWVTVQRFAHTRTTVRGEHCWRFSEWRESRGRGASHPRHSRGPGDPGVQSAGLYHGDGNSTEAPWNLHRFSTCLCYDGDDVRTTGGSLNKAKANDWPDVAIGTALVFSADSGLIPLLPGDPTAGALGSSFRVWSSVHTWTSVAMIAGVATHLGVVDDPYPGRCRRYTDSDGDGICGFSTLGSGTSLSTSQGGEWQGQFRPRRSDWGQQ
jgi:hypothetical protein